MSLALGSLNRHSHSLQLKLMIFPSSDLFSSIYSWPTGVAVTVDFLAAAAFAAGFGFRTVGSALGIGFPSLVCNLTTF
ncbi:hypothetical protein ALC56_09975 [Trachymyrmex septentrionalis]|uniref:Uncharacterized protein n=2 Tax=Attini TaxID=143999 RepID=A0A151JTX4_9HYME|nr:hypothetical protein ALC53_03627 [Atta colombica]KYN35677.1 hypothetical protein ALC56_09975 [Trachymyrmex septentrionalis]